MECEGAKPKWAVDHGLQLCGQYYQGFVEDYEAVLSHHRIETITSYGVRRSRQNASGTCSSTSLNDNDYIQAQVTKSSTDKV